MRTAKSLMTLSMELASLWCIVCIAADKTDTVGSLTYFQWFVVFSLLTIKVRTSGKETEKR